MGGMRESNAKCGAVKIYWCRMTSVADTAPAFRKDATGLARRADRMAARLCPDG